MEVVSVVINFVTALAAVAGVVTAAILGKKAVAVAAETVERSSLDYAAGRADLITQARVTLFETMAELKASMHVFWKEDPKALLAADSGSIRAQDLIERREDAEEETHRAMYRLQAAAERLREVLPTAQILEFERSKKANTSNRRVRGVRAPADVDMPSIIQLVDLYERGAMAMYFSLIPEKKSHANPKTDAELFGKHFMIDLELHDVEEGTSVWPDRVREWLGEELSVISNQTTHAIIAVNFVDSFLEKELAKAVHEVTSPVLAESRSGVFVSAKG